VGIKHRDAVAHVVEGNAQLGLAVTQLAQKTCVLDGDHRLAGKVPDQLDLLVGERRDLGSEDTDQAYDVVILDHRYPEHGMRAAQFDESSTLWMTSNGAAILH